jgi:hypothetical protein
MPDDVIDAPQIETPSNASETTHLGGDLSGAMENVDFGELDNFKQPKEEPKPADTPKGHDSAKPADPAPDPKAGGTPKPGEPGKPGGEPTPTTPKIGESLPKPETPAKTLPADDKDVDGIEAKPGSKPEIVDQIKNLKTLAKDARVVAREAQTKVVAVTQELEALKKSGAADPAEVKALRDRVAALEHYEYLVNPEASTFLTKEYDEKLKTEETKVYGILESLKIPEKAFKVKVKDADGKDTDQEVEGFSIEALKKLGGPLAQDYGWWEKFVLQNEKLPALERKRLEQALLGMADLTTQKKNAATAAPEKLKAYVAEQTATKTKADEQRTTEIVKRVQSLLPQVPYGQVREIPANATPEQKAEIEESNKFHEEAKRIFAVAIDPKTPQLQADVVTGFIHGLYLEKQMGRMQADLAAAIARAEAAEGKITGIKKAGSTRTNGSAPAKPTVDKTSAFFKSAEQVAAETLDAE